MSPSSPSSAHADAGERASFQTPIRTLAEFLFRTGGLAGSGLFQAAGRAVEGTRGHQRLQQSRGAGYEAELPIQWCGFRGELHLRLTGRIDGLWQRPGQPPLVEEIKTVDHRWKGEPDPVHLAQLQIYGAILAREHDWQRAVLQLTYLDFQTDEESPFAETWERARLDAFLDETLDRWAAWLTVQADWRQVRDASLRALTFPFGGFRTGQRALARRVYRRMREGGNAFLEAPTGLGKTLATLFPALKRLPDHGDGQLFYITAKTPGRFSARQAVDHLRAAGARLRVLSLTAKEKICFGPQPCDLRTCPFAIGYYERVQPAIGELLACEDLDRPAIEEVARRHTVCPFELGLDASLWTDMVIGDFNHVFDPAARLQRHFAEGAPRHLILVDEAHNLLERSRDMYSATLSEADLQPGPGAIRALGSGRVRQALAEALDALRRWEAPPSVLPVRDTHEGAAASLEAPDAFIHLLRLTAKRLEAFLADQPAGTPLNGWLEPFFAISAFLRAADQFDETYRMISAPGRLTLLCLDPSERLRETLKGVHAAVFFSATLAPLDYFRDLLGGEKEDEVARFGSPFSPEQMSLRIVPLDVTYRNRPESLAEVAQTLLAHLQAHPGNHLVFCPSLDYLAQLEGVLASQVPRLFRQEPAMDEAARKAFIERFESGEGGVGLAVLGGIFSEGIDLPGRALIGVTVIGVGLPRLSLERDLLEAYFSSPSTALEGTGRNGFDYAYRFPGMQRVLQAVGRLIRSESDQGGALLIDHRFLQARYRALFPGWWAPAVTEPDWKPRGVLEQTGAVPSPEA